jgi:hypothetical protein
MASIESTQDTARVHRCLRPGCSGMLTSPESIARGYSKACAAKVRAAAKTADLSAWTPSQVEEARQAIDDGAVVLSTRKGVFHVVSVDGTEIHLVHRHGCNCTSGLKTHQPRPCWHRCAVAIMTALEAPAAGLPTAPVALPYGTAPVAADVLSGLTDKLSAGGDILPVLADVWTALEAMGALAGASAPF